MTDFETRARDAKKASYAMAVLPTEVKDQALLKIADALNANKDAIFAANEIDICGIFLTQQGHPMLFAPPKYFPDSYTFFLNLLGFQLS